MKNNLFDQLLSLVPSTSKIVFQYQDRSRYSATINDKLRVRYLLGEYDDLISVSYTIVYSDSSYLVFNLENATEIFGYECYDEGFMYYEFNKEDYYNGIFKAPSITKQNSWDDMLCYENEFKNKNYIYIETVVVDQPIFEGYHVPWRFKKWLKADGLCFVDHGPDIAYRDIFKGLVKWTETKK